MANHGTPLTTKNLKKFSGTVMLNLPEIDNDLAGDLGSNGDAVSLILKTAFTRANLDKALVELGKKSEPQLLLIPIGTATVAATTAPFVARDRFVVNTGKKAPVKISYLGDNFKDWFLRKEEQPFTGSTLKYGKLSRYSVDGPIIKELGGEEHAETTLTELFALMEAQKNGENGPLLTNGYANIFYIKDAAGVLRAVYAGWSDDGWSVGAGDVPSPSVWHAGCQVFSRNSR